MLPFIKMHGLGNDFVIFDARRKKIKLTPQQAKAVADRRFGVGCDQVIVIEAGYRGRGGSEKKRKHPIPDSLNPRLPDVFMRIYNADGGEVGSCGNASRCVAWLLMEEKKKKSVTLETRGGIIVCERAGKMNVRADMGPPHFGWKQIPLVKEMNTSKLPIAAGACKYPFAVSMGNPHMVFVCNDIHKLPVSVIGPKLERHPLFPKRANVSFAEVTGKNKIRLRVWERGAGETLACGTAACAAAVALHRKGLVSRQVEVQLPGGTLAIEWDEKTDHVFMTGPVAVSFAGSLDV